MPAEGPRLSRGVVGRAGRVRIGGMGPLLDGLGSRSCWHGLDLDRAVEVHDPQFDRQVAMAHLDLAPEGPKRLAELFGLEGPIRLDALAMDNNDTVANRLATKTVNERAADESLKAP